MRSGIGRRAPSLRPDAIRSRRMTGCGCHGEADRYSGGPRDFAGSIRFFGGLNIQYPTRNFQPTKFLSICLGYWIFLAVPRHSRRRRRVGCWTLFSETRLKLIRHRSASMRPATLQSNSSVTMAAGQGTSPPVAPMATASRMAEGSRAPDNRAGACEWRKKPQWECASSAALSSADTAAAAFPVRQRVRPMRIWLTPTGCGGPLARSAGQGAIRRQRMRSESMLSMHFPTWLCVLRAIAAYGKRGATTVRRPLWTNCTSMRS
jgi:hypothetical protein